MLLRISIRAFALILWLHMLASASKPTYDQKYKFIDATGQESSYPTEGGKLEITCKSSVANEVLELVQKGRLTNTVVANGTGSMSHQFDLEPSLIGKSFECSSTSKFFGFRSFELNYVLCDPFPLVPKEQGCKNSQVCVINKDSTAACNELNDDVCFPVGSFDFMKNKFSSSLPTLRYACDGASNTESHSHGLCHARAMKLTNVTGMSYHKDQCNYFTALLLNDRKVYQDDFIIESKDLSNWNLKFDTTSLYDNIICKLSTSKQPRIAEFTSNDETQKSPILGALPIKEFPKPAKLNLNCAFLLKKRIIKAISLYVLVIDMKSFVYNTSVTTQVTTPKKTISLQCHCSVPSGFLCSLSWKKIENPPVISKDGVIKQDIFMKDHSQNDVTHKCYISVYVVSYPTSYKLVELQEARKLLPIVINKKDFDKSPGIITTRVESNSSANDTALPISSAETDSNPDEKSSSLSPGVIVAIVAVVLLLSIGLLIGLVFYRRSKTVKPTENLPETNIHPSRMSSSSNVLGDDKPANQRQSKTPKPIEQIQETNIHPSRQSNDQLGLAVESPAKQRKSDLRTKTATSKITRFNQMMLDDKENIVYSADLTEFLADMQEIITNGSALDKRGRSGYLMYMKRSKKPLWLKFSKMIDQLMLIIPPGKYLLTCRWSEIAIALATYVCNADKLSEVNEPLKTKNLLIEALHMNYGTNNDGDKAFILSQAPTEKEMEMFLEIIFSKNVTLIVTLLPKTETKDTENQINQYFLYFGMEKNTSKDYGRFTLWCADVEYDHTYESRSMTLRENKTNAPKSFAIFSYFAWQDKASPQDISHLISVKRSIESIQKTSKKNSKTLIHCSAGIGRTGLLVAAVNCMQSLSNNGCDHVNIYRIVEKLRNERIGALQTANQFCVLVWSLGEFLKIKFREAAPRVHKNKVPASLRTLPFSTIKKI